MSSAPAPKQGRVDPIGRDLSRQRARWRFAPGEVCALCGEHDSEVLRRPSARGPKSLLEVHHVLGRANDDELTIVLCLNCHRRASAGMDFAGVGSDPSGDNDRIARLVSVLRAIATFLQQLACTLMTWAEELVSSLDPDGIAEALDA